MKKLDLDKIKISSPYLVTWDSAIIRRDNPKFNDLVTEFTNTVILLNSKPE